MQGNIKITSICFDRIPVYVLNTLYLAPITLWTSIKHGRPVKVEAHRCHDHEEHGPDVQSSQQEGHTSEHNKEQHDMSQHGLMQEHAHDHPISGHSHIQHGAVE